MNDRPDRQPAATQEWLRRRSPELACGAEAPERALDAIKLAFARIFGPCELAVPDADVANRWAGEIREAGWRIQYRFGDDAGREYVDVFTSHRMTNDRLYRIHADGRTELLGASLDVVANLDEEMRRRERAFYDLVREHGFGAA